MRRLVLSFFVLLCAAAPAQAAGPRILVTGDSMMRYVDSRLETELELIEEVSFRSDVRIGSAVTKAPWVRISRRQAREHRPRATVVFIGANEGYDIAGLHCCGPAWLAEYEDHVKKMIRAYSRNGRGEVYWVTLPAAKSGRRVFLFPLLNSAIRDAVRTSGPKVHVVEAWSVFTPHGRYRDTMRWKGVEVPVRTSGGVHLTRQYGAQIAAEVIRDALRRDGVVH